MCVNYNNFVTYMTISAENVILVCSVIMMAGVLIGKSSYRTGMPLLRFRHPR